VLNAVIFDMDGVIIDSEPLHYQVDDMIFRELNISISYEERRSFVGIDNRRMWRWIKENYRLKESVDDLMALSHKMRNSFFRDLHDLEPVSGTVELISELNRQNIKTALASSSSMELIEIILKRLGIMNHFNIIVSGDFVERGKPDPDIFLMTLEKLEEEREKSIVIEDSENGVNAAQSAGIFCIAYNNPNSREQDLGNADIIIDNFSDMTFPYIKSLLEE
jgi:beta-phosphoglucomutase-like phosphatase (HAD superfamily)